MLSSITQEDKERARNEIEGKPVRIMEEEEGNQRGQRRSNMQT